MAAPAAAAKVQPAQQIPIWTWEGKTKTGEVKKGQMEAADEASVQQRLRAMALQNVKIRKKGMQLSFKLPGIGGISRWCSASTSSPASWTTSPFARCSPR